MKFAVEAWATEYGAPMEGEQMELSEGKVDLWIEKPKDKWAPIAPSPSSLPEKVLFTDGVRRIDARLWIESAEGGARPGVCATYAAGAICCDNRAKVVSSKVERGVFSALHDAAPINTRHTRYEVRRAEGDAPEQLWLAIQQRMAELESTIATDQDVDLAIVDGPLRTSSAPSYAVGYIKTHHVAYLPDEINHVVAALKPGERTPLFLTLGRFSRFSWYVRLPGGTGHPWAGVVRCEATADSETKDVIELADKVTALLPRFASESHKDPRAPQNLYPIAGLERELRRLLGDPALLYRDLKVASGAF
jgi:hypothetical protein